MLMNPLPPLVMYDIDGTLCDVSQALPLLQEGLETGDFREFHRAAYDCPPHREIVARLREDYENKLVVIVTARSEAYLSLTVGWLYRHNIPWHGLYMRGFHDSRPDSEVKRDIWRHLQNHSEIVHAYEDNPSVLRALEEDGIPFTRAPGWVNHGYE